MNRTQFSQKDQSKRMQRMDNIQRLATRFRQKAMSLCDFISDLRYGIQARRVGDIDGESDHQYFPSPRRLIHTTISNVACDLRRMTFMDFGSGLGRVVFCAARYPFREVLGVEYLPRLHQGALSNEKRFRRRFPNSVPIKLICENADNCSIPKTDCLLNFYNPFGEEVFEKVLNRIFDTYNRHHNKIYLCYQQSKWEPESTRTKNINLVEEKENSIFKCITYRYRSILDRLLLGIYNIKMFETC